MESVESLRKQHKHQRTSMEIHSKPTKTQTLRNSNKVEGTQSKGLYLLFSVPSLPHLKKNKSPTSGVQTKNPPCPGPGHALDLLARDSFLIFWEGGPAK